MRKIDELITRATVYCFLQTFYNDRYNIKDILVSIYPMIPSYYKDN